MAPLSQPEQFELFKRQIWQCVPIHRLSWPSSSNLTTEAALQSLYKNIFHSRIQHDEKWPCDTTYLAEVARKLVSRIEAALVENGIDPDDTYVPDELYEMQVSLAMSVDVQGVDIGGGSQAKLTTSLYTLPTPLEEINVPVVPCMEYRNALSIGGDTGMRTWTAALRLASFLVSGLGKDMLRGKNILELGSGAGLLSLIAGRHGETRNILATDNSDQVLRLASSNISLNNLSSLIETHGLDWAEDIDPALADRLAKADIILGADVIYDLDMAEHFAGCVSRILAQTTSEAFTIMANTVRNEDTDKHFRRQCAENHLDLEELDSVAEEMQTGLFHWPEANIKMYTLQLNRDGG